MEEEIHVEAVELNEESDEMLVDGATDKVDESTVAEIVDIVEEVRLVDDATEVTEAVEKSVEVDEEVLEEPELNNGLVELEGDVEEMVDVVEGTALVEVTEDPLVIELTVETTVVEAAAEETEELTEDELIIEADDIAEEVDDGGGQLCPYCVVFLYERLYSTV